MGGPTGLDYGAVLPVLELLEIPVADRRTVFAKLRLMEYAALEQIAKDRK